MTTDLREQLQQTLGDDYALQRELGGAGMSRVFVAEDTRLKRQIVVKVLPPEMTAGLSAERFQREIRISAGLQHPCIVPLLTTGMTQSSPFYTMPLVQGESLREKLAREGRLSVAEAIRVIRDVASALAYASDRGVVHRDLKPGNILLSGGYALVTDFGIAKAISVSAIDSKSPEAEAASSSGDRLTGLGLALGTPAYMAPEQAAGDPELDGRADLYALGVIAYEMLTGSHPFKARSGRAMLAAQMFEKPAPLERARPEVPAGLALLVMRCLEKEPASRPQSAKEVLDALDVGLSLSNLAHAPADVAERLPSIAVLPFTNLSPDRDNEYFSDGMTEEIINALSQMRAIRVAARMSSFAFKGKGADLKAIAETLNVTSVLEGSVRKSGDRLRVTAQLVDVAGGYHIWSERYDRKLADVFEVQDEIASAIANALRITLLPFDVPVAKKRPSDNLEAYQLYLKGRFYWNQRGEGLRKGLEFFQLALDLDPSYAFAHVGIADSYNFLGYFDVLSPDQSFLKGRSAALKALELDDSLAEAHAAIAAVSMCYDWDWSAAENEFQRALELNSEYVHALVWFALLRTSLLRFDEAHALARRAVEVDPLSAPAHAFLSYFLHAARRHEESVSQAEKTIELNPDAFFPHQVQGLSLQALGRTEDAIDALQKAVALSVRSPWAVGSLAYAYGRSGHESEAQALLKELLDRSSRSYVPWSRLALAYAGLAQTEKTLDCLEAAHEKRESWCPNLRVEAAWDEVRSHPRFTALVERMQFTA